MAKAINTQDADASRSVTFVYTHDTTTQNGQETPISLTYIFGATVQGYTVPYTFLWNFGDGQTTSGSYEVQQITHKYATAGTYTVTLTITETTGSYSSGSGSQSVVVT